MKKPSILLLMSALLIAGCSKTESTRIETRETTGQSQVQEDVSAETMKKEVGEAWDATSRYFTQERDKVQAEIGRTARKLDNRIGELKTERDSTADPGEKDRISIEIKGLEDERARLSEMGDKVKNASQGAWQDIKAGWGNLQRKADERVKASEQTGQNRRQ